MLIFFLSVLIFIIASLFFVFYLKNVLQAKWQETFKAISFDLMEKNTKSFLEHARSLMDKHQESSKWEMEGRQKSWEAVIKPMKEELTRIEVQTREIERRREGAYASLSQQVVSLLEMERALKAETANLTRALRSPNVRGSWGQLHLRRVVEISGMLPHCDFSEQKSFDVEGRMIRPDLIVHLPGDRLLVVDAKVPLDAYLEASETKDENVRLQKWRDHAVSLKNQIKRLSAKEYWKQFPTAPEYVVLFLPAEAFFSAALEVDSTLIEVGASQNVLIATPTTLIAILRAVAGVWKQEKLSQNAKEVAELGRELHERLNTLSEYWIKLGKSLNTSVETFNQAVSSLESRVFVSARKLKDAGAGSQEEIKVLEEIEKRAKIPAAELD